MVNIAHPLENAYVILKMVITKTIMKYYNVILRGEKQNVKLHITGGLNILKMRCVYCTDNLLETEGWIQ